MAEVNEIKIITIWISTITIVIIAFITLLEIYNGGFFFLAPSYNKTDKYLKEHFDKLSCVAEALSELDYDTIEIRKMPLREEEKYSMKVRTKQFHQDGSYSFDSDTIPIPGELVSYIETLYKSGIEIISCGDNFVDFTMWIIMEESRGIIYSRTEEKPDNEQLIKVRQLSKENWYYYVHNYEKAKARGQLDGL